MLLNNDPLRGETETRESVSRRRPTMSCPRQAFLRRETRLHAQESTALRVALRYVAGRALPMIKRAGDVRSARGRATCYKYVNAPE